MIHRYLFLFLLMSVLNYSQTKTWEIVHFDGYYGELNQIRMGELIDGELQIQWATKVGNYDRFTFGDCDNDGEDELIISKSDSILIINNNDFNDIEVIPIPNQIDRIKSIHVADVTGDGKNELIFARTYVGGQFFVYKFNSEIYEKLYQGSCWVFHLSVGDVDNDGIDEILLPESNNVRIINYDPSTNIFEGEINILSSGINDVAIVGDVTNNGENEIVVGGAHKEARIYKFIDNNFTKIGSLSFQGFTQGIAIGDVNGDNKNELLVGTTYPTSRLYVYDIHYLSTTLFNNLLWSDEILRCGIPGIYLGDFNGDEILDFNVDQEELDSKIYSYDGNDSFHNILLRDLPISKIVTNDFTFSNIWEHHFLQEIINVSELSGLTKLSARITNYGPSISDVQSVFSTSNPNVRVIDSLLTINNLIYTDTLLIDTVFSFEIIGEISDPSLTFNLSFYKDNNLISTNEINLKNPVGIFPDITNTVGLNEDFPQQQNSPLFIDIDNDNFSDMFVTMLYYGTSYDNNRLIYWGNSNGIFNKGGLAGNLNDMYLNFVTDINNDSKLEIVETGNSKTLMWENNDDSFTNITSEVGLSSIYQTLGGNSFDFNNDGLLDIYLATNESPDKLFMNNDDGTFTDVSESKGITSNSIGESVVTGDFNNDGLIDIYVGCYSTPNLFYIAELDENSNIVYRERAEEFGVDFVGDYMGTGFADINNDGFLDLFVLGWDASVTSYLMLNQNGNSFSDVSASSGFAECHGIDLAFIDYNHDEFIDVIAGGNQNSNDGNVICILQNNGNNTFTNVTAETVMGGNSQPNLFSVSDFDNDGRADLLTTLPLTLYKNNIDTLNWLAIKIKGIENNSLAIGAKVRLVTDGLSQFREVNSNSGNDTQLFFGLGENQQADSIIVNWSKGNVTVFSNVSSNQSVLLTENGDVISANEKQITILNDYILQQNYPNPFNPITKISYSISKPTQVTLKIYNTLGEDVVTLVDEFKSTGNYIVNFDGSKLSSGIYFYRLNSDEFVKTKKLMLLK